MKPLQRKLWPLLTLVTLSLTACGGDNGDGDGDGGNNGDNNGAVNNTNNGDNNANNGDNNANNGDNNANNGDNNGDNNGACQISCEAPAASCEGEVAVQYSGEGEITEDCACDFSQVEARVDCAANGQSCQSGACVDVEDLCADVDCESPAPTCEEQVLVSYDSSCDPGTGECSTETTREDCSEQGMACVDGACIDLCADVVCEDSPAPACDGDTLVVYEGENSCDPATGRCRSQELRTDCTEADRVCQGGACVDLCAEVDCSAPEATCQGPTAISYNGDGACDPATGQCIFDEVEQRSDCAANQQICQEGACVDLCADVDCAAPEAFCQEGVAVQYSDAGTCDFQTGTCDFSQVEARTNCTGLLKVCQEGACVDLCADVDCAAPADSCDGDVAVQYDQDGECDFRLGVCDFSAAEVRTNCADSQQVCQEGACVDLCDGVDCRPPTDSCDGSVAVQYSGAGTCDFQTGACGFQDVVTTTDCADTQQVCQNGECVDLCADQGCEAPEAFCDQDTLVTWTGPGACNFETGACDFTQVEQRTNCADSQQICREGACVDLCAEVSCDQPEDFCDRNTAVQYSDAGTCNFRSGACDFTQVQTRTNCVTNQQVCQSGDCVDLCADVDCSAPVNFCQGDIAVRYIGDGACDFRSGACDFDQVETRTDCAAFGNICQSGECVDLCDGVACTAPEATCEGQVAVGYLDDGTCSPRSGECDFSRVEVRVDCTQSGLICQGARCVRDAPRAPRPGDLVITEIMQNPAAITDAEGEWFEIYNTSSQSLILNGVLVTDNGRDSFTIQSEERLLIPGLSWFVLGRNGDVTTNGGIEIDYVYEGFNLANGTDTVAIYAGESLIDSVTYDDGATFPDPNGASMQLGAEYDLLAQDNADGALWCTSRSQISDTNADFGTPGAPNDICVLPEQRVTVFQLSDESAQGHPAIGTPVLLADVVITVGTRQGENRFVWAQAPGGGPFSGIHLNLGGLDPLPSLERGDQVRVRGVYTEGSGPATRGLATLEVTEITVVAQDQPVPAPQALAPRDLATPEAAERWESTLVRLNNSAVSDANPDGANDFAEFTLGGAVRVDDLLYEVTPDPALGDNFVRMVGVLNFSYDNFKIEPRDAGDVEAGALAYTEVEIANFAMNPDPVNIPVGSRVRWTNRDAAAHTATSGNPGDIDAGSFFDSGLLMQGEQFSFVFRAAGTYLYFCRPHAGFMLGYQIFVEPTQE